MIVRLSHLSKSYFDASNKLTVINDINFEFPESGSVAIVGRSGVGKSTLLHMIGGLDSVTRGSVFFDEHNITEMSQDEISRFRGKNISFIFQFHHLLGDFTALENVAMPLLLQRVDQKAAFSSATEMLARVGLSDRIHHTPGELSGGEQQRVAIARALVTKPAVLLADEPTGNLDHQTAVEVQGLLYELQREQKMLCIVVTHSLELAKSFDQTYEMLPGGELKLAA